MIVLATISGRGTDALRGLIMLLGAWVFFSPFVLGFPTQPLTIVSNGQQAIKYLSGDGSYGERLVFPLPSLMLLDLHMPYVDGFAVLRWVRAKPGLKLIPITVLT